MRLELIRWICDQLSSGGWRTFEPLFRSLIGAQTHRWPWFFLYFGPINWFFPSNPPVVHDDMWDADSRYDLCANASLTTIKKRVNDLQMAMRTFTDGNRMTTHPNWKCILRHIYYTEGVMSDIDNYVRHSFASCCWWLTAFPAEWLPLQ